MDREDLFKEIDLIQECIRRMSHNSFMVKGWALTVLAGVTAFTHGDNFKDVVLLICSTTIPFVCFWLLDAFFLHIERKYRRMYDIMLEKRRKGDTTNQFELNPKHINVNCFGKTLFSATLSLFYGIPLLCCIVVIVHGIIH